MRIVISARYVLAVFAAVSMLAGCGGGSSSIAPTTPSNSAGGAPPPRSHNADVIYTFQGGSDGNGPLSGLLLENGQFYGTTEGAGTGGSGTAYRISPSGTLTVLYSFSGGSDAANPEAGLTAGPGGVLYGDTLSGGAPSLCASYGCGAVYELVPSGSGYSENIIHAFHAGGDGANPAGGLLIDQSGAIYGTTLGGGGAFACTGGGSGSYASGCGTVFKLTPSGSTFTETILYSFQGGNDGANPGATLIADGTGALYGTTEYGGASASVCTSPSGYAGCGTVFKLTPSGSGYSESILYRFQGGTDGAVPESALLAGSNGALFGATERGGANGGNTNHGTVYELMPSGSGYSERVIFRFDASDGAFPRDENGLYADNSGNLYGTASGGGGGKGCGGVVFKLAPSGSGFTDTTLYRFRGAREHDGCNPVGSLTADASGTLYGTTADGGLRIRHGHHHGFGTIFKISP
jgi:uncharacterized repeat protein (TIGR03803 family)